MRALLFSAAFLIGVAARSLYPLGWAESCFLLSIAFAAILFSLLAQKSGPYLLAGGLLCVFVVGMARADYALVRPFSVLDEVIGRERVFEGVVVDEPDARETSVLLTIGKVSLLEDNSASSTPSAGNILAILPAYSSSKYGDVVRIKGTLEFPESFESETGREFDYPGYLAVSGIYYTVLHPEVEVLAHDKGNSLLASLYSVKRAYLSGIQAALPEPQASLAGGITAGDKRSLGEDLLEDFRITGIVHIVVLSGYNMTIIAETLLKMLAWLPLRVGLGAGIFGIVLFALMTGAGASIVRASIMAILALLARVVGRTYVITRALLLAVVGMVAWNPLVLLHDPGFQLSVLATIGLVYVSPFIEKRLVWVPKKFGLREIVGATIGTQVTVLPLLLYQMGTLSLVALPVNVLVLSVMPLAMFFSFVAAVVGMLVPGIAIVAGLPAYLVLAYIFAVVELGVRIPFAAVTIPAFPEWIMMVAYVFLGVWLWFLYRKR